MAEEPEVLVALEKQKMGRSVTDIKNYAQLYICTFNITHVLNMLMIIKLQ